MIEYREVSPSAAAIVSITSLSRTPVTYKHTHTSATHPAAHLAMLSVETSSSCGLAPWLRMSRANTRRPALISVFMAIVRSEVLLPSRPWRNTRGSPPLHRTREGIVGSYTPERPRTCPQRPQFRARDTRGCRYEPRQAPAPEATSHGLVHVRIGSEAWRRMDAGDGSCSVAGGCCCAMPIRGRALSVAKLSTYRTDCANYY